MPTSTMEPTKESNEHEKDLPLMANTDDVLVKHFILDLTCDFDERTMTGSILIFLKPTHQEIKKDVKESSKPIDKPKKRPIIGTPLLDPGVRKKDPPKNKPNSVGPPVTKSSLVRPPLPPHAAPVPVQLTRVPIPGHAIPSHRPPPPPSRPFTSPQDNLANFFGGPPICRTRHPSVRPNFPIQTLASHHQGSGILMNGVTGAPRLAGPPVAIPTNAHNLYNRYGPHHAGANSTLNSAGQRSVNPLSNAQPSPHSARACPQGDSNSIVEDLGSFVTGKPIGVPNAAHRQSQSSMQSSTRNNSSIHSNNGRPQGVATGLRHQLANEPPGGSSVHNRSRQTDVSPAEDLVAFCTGKVLAGETSRKTPNTNSHARNPASVKNVVDPVGYFTGNSITNSLKQNSMQQSAQAVRKMSPNVPNQRCGANIVTQTNTSNFFSGKPVTKVTKVEELFHGSPVKKPDRSAPDFRLILDCCDLVIKKVEEVRVPPDQVYKILSSYSSQLDTHTLNKEYMKCWQYETCPLSYNKDKWSLQVWKKETKSVDQFPRVIKICYRTSPQGASLKWTQDQDGRLCVFTPAAWINNRALFPCQEPPVAMSTWQAKIQVPQGAKVLMSGNENAVMKEEEHGLVSYYYSCSMALPSSTLAIACGYWNHVAVPSRPAEPENTTGGTTHINRESTTSQGQVPSRIFAPKSLLPKAQEEYSSYIANCLRAAYQLLGPHPFPRLDVLIVPTCFDSLGLANPNLMFLSQSLVAGDKSMTIRVAHELSHAWFGLLIGTRDWTEEWLSEGFATYMEDSIHARTMQWSVDEQRDHSELRAIIRHRTLSAELENTEEDLQTLRPNQGRESRDQDTGTVYVKNGLNPDKAFTQVHYLKGYFLLRHLSELVGVARFDDLLRVYIMQYQGQLVTSQEVFKLLFDNCPLLKEKGMTIAQIYSDWLDHPGMPKPLQIFTPNSDNKLYGQVLAEVEMWKKMDAMNKKGKGPKKQKLVIEENMTHQLDADQIVLLLELLLEQDSMATASLEQLNHCYGLSTANADVRHRWCELVIKHQVSSHYEDVRRFLKEDQAMGVYLYGEAVLSGCAALRQLAEDVFQELRADMEPGVLSTVQQMLYGDKNN